MKKLWVIVAVIAVVAGLFLLLRPKNPPPENPTAQNTPISENVRNTPADQAKSSSASNVAVPATAAPDALASRAASPNTAVIAGGDTNTLADLPPLTVLDKARVVIHNYRAAFGENPVGTNPEITAALKGKNPKQTDFLADSGLRVNEKAELVDGYGTPFFFHQISGQEMEIRSAGPDQVMWTTDDLVTK